MDSPDPPVLDLSPHREEVVRVLLRRLDPDLPAPAYARSGDAGADLLARHDAELPPGGRATVATGVALALPEGYAAFVHPRSGLAARHGVTTLNGPGTVDAGYRGEVLVTLVNTDRVAPFSVRRGDRVAQLVVQRVARASFDVVDDLPGSDRGTGGHGSTGGVSASSPPAAVVPAATSGRPWSATVGVDAVAPPAAGGRAASGTSGTSGALGAVDHGTTETAGGAGAPGEEQS